MSIYFYNLCTKCKIKTMQLFEFEHLMPWGGSGLSTQAAALNNCPHYQNIMWNNQTGDNVPAHVVLGIDGHERCVQLGRASLNPPCWEVVWFLKYPLYFAESLNLSAHLPHFEPGLGGSSWTDPAVECRGGELWCDTASLSRHHHLHTSARSYHNHCSLVLSHNIQ